MSSFSTWFLMPSAERVRMVAPLLVATLLCGGNPLASAAAEGASNGIVRSVSFEGVLGCGTARYRLSGAALLGDGGVTNLTMVMGQGMATVAVLHAWVDADLRFVASFAGNTIPLDPAYPARWGALLTLTERDVETSIGMTLCGSSNGLHRWESAGPAEVGPGLPMKVAYFFDGEGSGVLAEVLAYGLADWNNRFNADLVLRLKLRREVARER